MLEILFLQCVPYLSLVSAELVVISRWHWDQCAWNIIWHDAVYTQYPVAVRGCLPRVKRHVPVEGDPVTWVKPNLIQLGSSHTQLLEWDAPLAPDSLVPSCNCVHSVPITIHEAMPLSQCVLTTYLIKHNTTAFVHHLSAPQNT